MLHFGSLIHPLMDEVARMYGYPHVHFPRVMLARLKPQADIKLHLDEGTTARTAHKIHVPLYTNDRTTFDNIYTDFDYEAGVPVEYHSLMEHSQDYVKNSTVMGYHHPGATNAVLHEVVREARQTGKMVRQHLKVGSAYEVNNRQPHGGINHGKTDRVHLIFEIHGGLGEDRMERALKLPKRSEYSFYATPAFIEEGAEPGSDWHREAAKERLERAKPLSWLHIPKTGTSIGHTILPTVCPPRTFPSHSFIGSPRTKTSLQHIMHQHPLAKVCPGGFSTSFKSPPGHMGLGQLWNKDGAWHAVSMFRQPEQRLISGWLYGRHSARAARTIEEYRDRVKGCQVRMIVRGGVGDPYRPMSGPCGDASMPPVTKKEVALAIQRVNREFAFVGLTEKWALSVCLWHAMFGGECRDFQFMDMRPGKKAVVLENGLKKPEQYNVTNYLGTWRDQLDGALYREAEKRFWRDIKTYGVSDAVCRKYICPKASSFYEE